MRLLHTSDWHLGHTLHDASRDREHVAFLDWLAGALADHAVDALVVAGDLFDSANPSPHAPRMFYGFLARIRRSLPALDVVLVGGNHDSSARLDTVRPLLALIGRLHIVGGLPRRGDESVDTGALLVPLTGASGAVEAWVAAVPYLRPADLPPGPDLVAGGRTVYAQALDAARAARRSGQALIATGHCFRVGGQLSELSDPWAAKPSRSASRDSRRAPPPSSRCLIDEGFGTLDPEALETALGVLDSLESAGRADCLTSTRSTRKRR
jgi:exonuclease SbcD